MQRSLTGPLGTWGATNIRFLFGFPFSILFFAVVVAATGDHVPWPTAAFWPWLLLGALSQIVATGLMLLAMNDRSFVVTTAYLKTEAIQTAIFGFVFLGDHLTLLKVIAILIATVGVVITALRPGGEKGFADLKPTMLGLVAAAAFALSAVGFRGAIIMVPGVSFVTAASYTLVFGLFVQTLVLTIYLLLRAPDVLKKILGLWKPSMLAGFMGAFASQFWFLAFALTAAANVRTLALVEVLFAQGVAYYSFKQPLSARELVRHRADRDRRGAVGGGAQRLNGDQHRAGGDQGDAEPAVQRGPFAEKDHAEQRHQHDAQFVDRRHQRRRPKLQRAEIAEPRRAGAEPGQHQEDPALGRDRAGLSELTGREQDQRQADQHDDGADQGREIGIDVLDADLGEDRGQRGEHGGQQGPDQPGRKRVGAHQEVFNIAKAVIARSEATKQSILFVRIDGLLRFARNDAARQFRSSGSTGSGDTSTPSSISARASSGEASP